MAGRTDYRSIQQGPWKIWVHDRLWTDSAWLSIQETVERRVRQDHPESIRLKLQGRSEDVFLKIYSPGGAGTGLKDLFRVSKALRHWQQSLALSGCGFRVPTVIAVGEQRRFRRVERSFILTEWTDATSVSTFLRGADSRATPLGSTQKKRAYIRQLGYEIGRMHELGFVHGDLVLSNVLVGFHPHGPSFYYIDHDRTRRYPEWLPQTLWKRNLVQLNRLVVPGITLSDRMRFFRAYATAQSKMRGLKPLGLLRWLESRTRRRRFECDGVAGNVSFRELMRWNGPYGDKREIR